MGSKPKQEDYKPSEAEKASAAVARAEKLFFDQNYAPKLREMRDKAQNFNFGDAVRGRANADVMQALTGEVSFRGASDVSRMGNTSQAISGQLQKADAATANVVNKLSTGVLGTARGQAADAQSGMAQASRLATSEALARAKAEQQAASAKFDMFAGLGLAAAMRGKQEYDKNKEARMQQRGEEFLGNPVTAPQTTPFDFLNPPQGIGPVVNNVSRRMLS